MLRRGGEWARKEQEEIARMFQGKGPGRHVKLRFASADRRKIMHTYLCPIFPFNLTLNAQNVTSKPSHLFLTKGLSFRLNVFFLLYSILLANAT